MSTYFDQLTKVRSLTALPSYTTLTRVESQSFVQVPLEPGVETLSFLEAAEGLIKMFGQSDILLS